MTNGIEQRVTRLEEQVSGQTGMLSMFKEIKKIIREEIPIKLKEGLLEIQEHMQEIHKRDVEELEKKIQENTKRLNRIEIIEFLVRHPRISMIAALGLYFFTFSEIRQPFWGILISVFT